MVSFIVWATATFVSQWLRSTWLECDQKQVIHVDQILGQSMLGYMQGGRPATRLEQMSDYVFVWG